MAFQASSPFQAQRYYNPKKNKNASDFFFNYELFTLVIRLIIPLITGFA
jgi:hypothetical protein